MSDSQDLVLDYEYDIQGADLLNKSANFIGEPMEEEEVIMVEEVQVLHEPAESTAEPEEDLGCMLACGDRDIFEEEDASSLYTASQLLRELSSSPTQKDPGVPACSQVVAEILKDIPKPEGLDWVAVMDAQDTEE